MKLTVAGRKEIMLRLADQTKHHPVTICDVEFQMRSMSVREKFVALEKLNTLKPTSESFDAMTGTLSDIIMSIDGNENVRDVLNSIESFEDLISVVHGVIGYCSFTDDESKNSGSSSDTSTPTPTGE